MSFADPQRQHPSLSFKSDPLCPVTVAQWCSEDCDAGWTTQDFFFLMEICFTITQLGGDMFSTLNSFMCLLVCFWCSLHSAVPHIKRCKHPSSISFILICDYCILFFGTNSPFQWNFTHGTPRSRCVIHTQSNFIWLPEEQRNEIWGASSAGVPATLCSASERKS